LKETLNQAEKQALTTALHQSNGDKIEAAKRLKIGKSSFYDKLKKYNL
jgi:transcriptional regulator with PAS, ATPase and Fis domain